MFFYSLVFLRNNGASEARLISPDGATPPLDLICQSEKRTLFNIVWGCLSTITICAWTSVHPNVPPPNKWRARWDRLKIMFWVIIAPELVIAWAVRQLFAAKEIRDAYNHSRKGIPDWRRWTLAHGHLLAMGGFTFIDPDLKKVDPKNQNPQVVTYDRFKELIRNPEFEVPDISVAEIQDKSKGDPLWKTVAILQTAWFIMQCIARSQQQLALTELELFALASLNSMTIAFWWHKPLGVQEPVKIYWKIEGHDDGMETIPRWEDSIRSELSFGHFISQAWEDEKHYLTLIVGFLQNPCEAGWTGALLNVLSITIEIWYFITFPFFLLFPLGIVFLLKVIKTDSKSISPETSQSRGLLASRILASLHNFRYDLTLAVGHFVGKRLEGIFAEKYDTVSDFLIYLLFGWFFLLPALFVFLLPFVVFLISFLTLIYLVSFIFTTVFGIVTTSTIRPGASYVPSFYAPSTESDRWSRMVIFALFGVIFGGIHCVGWYFKYPTQSEQTIWRATSLAITVVPLIVAPVDFLLATRLLHRGVNSCGKVERIALLSLDLVMTVLLFIYVPARLFLITQALTLLRNQPPSALVAVDWTKYIPHLFS